MRVLRRIGLEQRDYFGNEKCHYSEWQVEALNAWLASAVSHDVTDDAGQVMETGDGGQEETEEEECRGSNGEMEKE